MFVADVIGEEQGSGHEKLKASFQAALGSCDPGSLLKESGAFIDVDLMSLHDRKRIRPNNKSTDIDEDDEDPPANGQ